MALLEVEGLTVRFTTYEGEVHAVEKVSFCVEEGEFFGLVGETGCGKSVTALSLLGLLAANGRVESGSVRFQGLELLGLSEQKLRRLRGDAVAYIFQEPLAALNPVHRVARQLTEVLLAHRLEELVEAALAVGSTDLSQPVGLAAADSPSRPAAALLRLLQRAPETRAGLLLGLPLLGRWYRWYLQRQADPLLEQALAEVGLPDPASIARRYPHELSGGMAQRVMVAMALAGHPRLLIADEPTTALDVTIQAQFLDLLREIQTRRNFSVLLITHNLGVVRQLCHRVAVMYAGQIVEQAPAAELFTRPYHPYTRGLLAALPRLEGQEGELTTLPGAVPDLLSPARGCRFAPRCAHALEVCQAETPPLRQASTGHTYLCHLTGGGRHD